MYKYGLTDDSWLKYYQLTRKYDLDYHVAMVKTRLLFMPGTNIQRITHQIRTEYLSCLVL